MNMNNSQTTPLKTPQQIERVNKIIGSFRQKLREANVKAAQKKDIATRQNSCRMGGIPRSWLPESGGASHA